MMDKDKIENEVMLEAFKDKTPEQIKLDFVVAQILEDFEKMSTEEIISALQSCIDRGLLIRSDEDFFEQYDEVLSQYVRDNLEIKVEEQRGYPYAKEVEVYVKGEFVKGVVVK